MANTQQLKPYLDPLKFYNYGDNPALKNFMRIAMENNREKKVVDHRNFVIFKSQRYILARNWDDFLQRDLNAINFQRAFGLFILNTLFCIASYKVTRKLLPVGKFGIRRIQQTPFYQNFGPLGVVGAGSFCLTGIYTQYKTFKFTLHKFYRHVLMGERNWYLEEVMNTSQNGTYDFSDSPLSDLNTFPKSEAATLSSSLKRDFKPTFKGAYGEYK